MPRTRLIIGMRDAFFDALFDIARRDRDLIIVSADNGAPTLDQFAEKLKNQFFTVGIAEQQMIGMATGLAVEGKRVYTYAIAPFVTSRCFEQNKLDICAMNLPITCLGVGAGFAYDIMGPTHHAVEDLAIMRVLPNMSIFSPADSVCAAALAQISYDNRSPQYIRFDRAGIPLIYKRSKPDFRRGLVRLRKGRDVTLIAAGIMVHQALHTSDLLAREGVRAGVVDLFRIKPVNFNLLLEILEESPAVVSMEEHFLAGGLGSLLAENFMDHGVCKPLLRIGMGDSFAFEYGGRETIWRKHGLDAETVTARICRWLRKRKA